MKMKLGSSSTATDARPGATPRKRDLKKAFLLALAIHAALFVALLFAFQWKTQNEEVYAELWASVPTSGTSEHGGPVKGDDGAAEPPPPESTPAPEPKPEPPAPAPKPAPAPAPAPAPKQSLAEERKADIVAAQEKAKKQKAEQLKAQQEEQKRIADAKRAADEAKKKAVADEQRRQAAAKAQMEKVRQAEAARLAQAARQNAMAKVRGQELARVADGKPSQTTAGVPTGDRTAQFQNLSGSAKAAFIARVTACIRPNIIFNVPSGIRRGQHQAVYRVRLMPTGDQIGAPHKTRGSGLPGYDSAVERAIAKCPKFPTVPGTPMPGEVTLTFDPIDSK